MWLQEEEEEDEKPIPRDLDSSYVLGTGGRTGASNIAGLSSAEK